MPMFLTVAFTAPALACTEDEGFLFSCATEKPEHSLSLCGQQVDEGNGLIWKSLRFVYQTEKGEGISFPADPANGPKEMFFSHLFRNDLYEAAVRFDKDGLTYRLFFKDQPESPNPDEVSGPDAGLEVAKNGVVTETIRCSERPAAYFDEMRKLLACDLQNPYGEQGCSNQPPIVK